MHSRHFTLHVAAPSTKKTRGLKFAFSARSGHAAARNRAKRYAREAYRVGRHKLPNDTELVISSRHGIGTLTRHDMRKELAELFDRVGHHPPGHVSRPSR
ncbi:MAG: ribonuclease P protein component [Candidatus Methylomirabilaceae bacterium]